MNVGCMSFSALVVNFANWGMMSLEIRASSRCIECVVCRHKKLGRISRGQVRWSGSKGRCVMFAVVLDSVHVSVPGDFYKFRYVGSSLSA